MIDKKLLKRIDWFTLLLVFTLFGIGIVSMASIMASPFDGQESSIGDYMAKLNLTYVNKQIAGFFVGLAACIVVIIFDYQVLKPFIKYIYIANVLVLGALFLADKQRGIHGWFMISWLDRAIQPAELCKISIIVMLAKAVSQSMDKNGGKLKGFRSVLEAVAYCAIPTVLVMLQPDFGTAFVYICILVFMFFVAKIAWGYILTAAGTLAAGLPLAYFFLMKPEQQARINVFLDPSLDPAGKGYNVSQSKIAIGSGQLWGKGFFSSDTMAQLRFVPERHTDFIFAGIVEGIGFVGGTAIIVLYFILVFRWLYIALKAKDNFGTCIVVGVMGMLIAHVFENIGMTIGLTPVTGIPLPFISYGGSNLLTNLIGVGLVVNIWMRRPQKR
ncbi:MAG TPA: rod shape-determining protein RodA [Clostridia bacterium]|jgi:rod shape determining protein RodA|nr:rod shape-determining protein RodA [Clostridia bacterium]